MDVMCSLKVATGTTGWTSKKVFESALPKLAEMERDGLVKTSSDGFEVEPLGRLFLRNIAMLFDGRLAKGAQRYSKTI